MAEIRASLRVIRQTAARRHDRHRSDVRGSGRGRDDSRRDAGQRRQRMPDSKSGDVITSVNSESISGRPACAVANEKLLDFMRGVEEGDELDVEYLRDGKVGTVEITTTRGRGQFPEAPGGTMCTFFGGAGRDVVARGPRVELQDSSCRFRGPASAGASIEIVELNEGLGRYFGTDSGLLVVRAPESDAFKLQDGDVIQSIDGREPGPSATRCESSRPTRPARQLELRHHARQEKAHAEHRDAG